MAACFREAQAAREPCRNPFDVRDLRAFISKSYASDTTVGDPAPSGLCLDRRAGVT